MLAIIAIPTIALAIADPDIPPEIKAIYVYEDGLLEEGDVGVLVDYYIEYGTVPDETATDAYLFMFIDTDGVTQLKTIAPYSYNDNGYGRGIAWIYFTAAEVTTHSIDSANEALYEVWLVGNPTLDWTGIPPKVETGISNWYTTGVPNFTLAQDVLYYADLLEEIWATNLIEYTPLGNKLATAGESYFSGAIANLRDMAPACFSVVDYEQVMEDIDHTTSFGAVVTGDDVAGSPVTLVEGSQIVTTTGTANFTVELNPGTSGNITDLAGSVTGSPVNLVAGTNEIEVTGAGTLTFVVNLITPQTIVDDLLAGTVFDLTNLGTDWGLTREMTSGVIWFVITVLICAGVYGSSTRVPGYTSGAGKIVLLVFDVCIIGGALIGMIEMLAAVLLFIGFGAITGYVLFFRGAHI